MAQPILDRALHDLNRLEPHELSRVGSAVDHKFASASAQDKAERYLQALVRPGLIAGIKRPGRGDKLGRAAVPITGMPLSETIVEDRR